MSNAIVLIDVESGKASQAAQKVAEIPCVREVYSVAGDVDLVAIVHADDADGLTEIIPDGIAQVEGVLQTHTLMAFRAYSGKDLAAAFELGLD